MKIQLFYPYFGYDISERQIISTKYKTWSANISLYNLFSLTRVKNRKHTTWELAVKILGFGFKLWTSNKINI